MTWFTLIDDKKLFNFGIDDYPQARDAAQSCLYFIEDDEDEQIDNVVRSCYNCAYRRWLINSFECKHQA
ncbi:hypothetical protein [Shewanella marina]|uniref:hypothetical protein n=1 Tax=Shewanella marina TaxID=487319 RepID=UPI0004727CF4|nr:hypothetical protein [Shewanella marina]